MFRQPIPERFVPLCNIKKNPAKQDSPPAAGRASDILPFRRSAIRAERFYRMETKFSIRKECALAHSRAEARLPRQPSTPAPSAHPRGAFLSYGNEVFYTIKNPTSTTEAAQCCRDRTWDFIMYLVCNCSEQVEALAAETVRI